MSIRTKSLVIVLLFATLALSLVGPAISGISSIQQAKAAMSGQNGKPGTNECGNPTSHCNVGGGAGGSGNVDNRGNSLNGNGGNGGFAEGKCTSRFQDIC